MRRSSLGPTFQQITDGTGLQLCEAGLLDQRRKLALGESS
jgi:hypothetical protein